MKLLQLAAIISLFIASSAQAQVIDFESVPGVGQPVEGMLISTQYEAQFGVSFELIDNTGMPVGFPKIATIGSPLAAFGGCPGPDTPLPGQGVGASFLTTNGFAAQNLRVAYSSPVNAASGRLLDVDRNCDTDAYEEWTISAYDAMGTFLGQDVVTGPQGPTDPLCPSGSGCGPGNGASLAWSISTPTASIVTIDFVYTGTNAAVGVAFDNFSPATSTSGVPFCNGIGCPCANDSTTTGCVNSTGTGSLLSASGSTSFATDALRVDATCPPSNSGLILVNTIEDVPLALFDGLNCVRGGPRVGPGADNGMVQPFGDVDLVANDGIRNYGQEIPGQGFFGIVNQTFPGYIGPGGTYSAQYWYRDVLCGPPPAPCASPCGMNANFSNGLTFTVTP